MKIVTVWMVVLLCCGVLPADQRPFDRAPRADGIQADQLKTYLGLSDQQLQDLKALQGQFREAARPIAEQLGEKAKELRQARQQDPVDEALVSRLQAEIAGLQSQVAVLRTQFQSHAQGVLTADQMARLAALEQALALVPAAHQAAALNLLDAPEGAPGRGMGPQSGGRRNPGGPPAGFPRP